MNQQEKDRLVSSQGPAAPDAGSSSSDAATKDTSAVDDDNSGSSSNVPAGKQMGFSVNNTNLGGAGIPSVRIVTLGSVAVGKSSIIARFMYDAYDRHYRATLGIDFLTKLVSVHGQTVKLAIWDTAGQERFRSLIPSYIRNSAGAIIVYDVSNRDSFIDTARWVEDVRQERGADSGVVFFLVANKIDLDDRERVVTSEEGEAKARELGATYIEVSAKTGVNIKALFRKVSTTIPLPRPEEGGGGGGGAGAAGGAAAGIGLPPVRRIDPLLVTPSNRVNLSTGGAGAGAGDDAGAGGICGAC